MPKNVVRLNFQKDMSWGYIEGYRRAANALAKAVTVEEQNCDFFIYPMGFLYRHHVELQLKWLIQKFAELSGQHETPPRHHRLQQLWEVVRSQLKKLPVDSKALITEVEHDLKLLDQIDRSAQEFRYTTTEEKGVERQSLAGISLLFYEQFYCQCENLATNLQVVHDWLSVELDRRNEVQAMQQEFYSLDD